jgi:drug/metabolite transporter (DMT)-like permease
MEYVGPFAYNGIRFILGSISLLPLIFIRWKISQKDPQRSPLPNAAKPHPQSGIAAPPLPFLTCSLAAGTCLFLAVILQQSGLLFTTAGNAGFITGLYVVLTPIFGIFLGRKTGPATWLGSLFTLAVLFFVCAGGQFDAINPGDIIIMVSAVFWACHVLLIDRIVQDVDPIALSSGQFAICGIFALVGAFLVEPFVVPLVEYFNPALLDTGTFAWLPFPTLLAGLCARIISFPVDALIPILYGGLGSVGIAYTLQAVAQRDAPPAHATIILCFEGCFAALGGALLLAEKIGPWTFLGFILMLAGMLVTQWEVIAKKNC